MLESFLQPCHRQRAKSASLKHLDIRVFLAELAFVKFQVGEYHTTCTTLYSASFGSIWCVAPLGS